MKSKPNIALRVTNFALAPLHHSARAPSALSLRLGAPKAEHPQIFREITHEPLTNVERWPLLRFWCPG